LSQARGRGQGALLELPGWWQHRRSARQLVVASAARNAWSSSSYWPPHRAEAQRQSRSRPSEVRQHSEQPFGQRAVSSLRGAC
jgi:hypothetical protein